MSVWAKPVVNPEVEVNGRAIGAFTLYRVRRPRATDLAMITYLCLCQHYQ